MDDDMSQWLNAWIAFSAEARQRLATIHGRVIESGEFTEAVRELWGAENQLMMLYTPIPTVDEIIEQLKDYPFEPPLGEPLQTITLTESILPEDWLRLLEEQTLPQGGEIWRIHQNDADPFPSSPHAHNLENGLKLHLGTGYLYKKRKIVSRIRCKDLRKLRAQVTEAIQLPTFECD